MNEKRIIKESTKKAPTWGQIVEHYRARPGLVKWLADRHPVMRGEIEDSQAPDVTFGKENQHESLRRSANGG